MEFESILKGVSRSFYLSLKFLPGRLRSSMKLAFLFCKVADTIADTKIVPREQRLELLNEFRSYFVRGDWHAVSPITLPSSSSLHPGNGKIDYERELLLNLPQLFEAFMKLKSTDATLIQELVIELTQGMITDLSYFPGENTEDLVAFESEEQLDQYTYFVAGCVGRFWTRVMRAHYRFAKAWNQEQQEQIGEDFGKGLQMVNVLRDLPRDLNNARCYLPRERLTPLGLTPEDLLSPTALPQAKSYLKELIARTRQLLSAGEAYTRAFPWYALRLKWVVILPMKLGFQTLDLLENSQTWLEAQQVHKVSRKQVRRTMAKSLLCSFQ